MIADDMMKIIEINDINVFGFMFLIFVGVYFEDLPFRKL